MKSENQQATDARMIEMLKNTAINSIINIITNTTTAPSMYPHHNSRIYNTRTQQHIQCKRERRGKQKLRTFLYEFLAITTTAASVNAATPITIATTRIVTTGTRLIPLNDATSLTATFPIITNATKTNVESELPTIATNLSATIFTNIVTAKAFIQMNVTAYRSYGMNDVNATSLLNATSNLAITTTTNVNSNSSITCPISTITSFSSSSSYSSIYAYLGALPWPNALAVAIFVLLFLVTVAGNLLVIVSVLTTRRLRTVTNCFVLNLAITDLLVGLFVMPPAVILYVVGSWRFGWILCDIWISLDVLLCTGSILSLCAISLDRYLAVTQPLTYSKKRRSKRLALFMILIVWVTALLITCPPYFGWYEQAQSSDGNINCRYNQNKGYVVFSAMGSFFIPLAVMMYVYLKIGYVLKSRRQRIVRDANSERVADHDIDCDNFLSESEHFHCTTPRFPSFKTRWGSANGSNNICTAKQLNFNCDKCNQGYVTNTINKAKIINDSLGGNVIINGLKQQTSFYELVEISHLTSVVQCSAINCRYAGGVCVHSGMIVTPLGGRHSSSLPMNGVHLVEDGISFTENCLREDDTVTNTSMTKTTTTTTTTKTTRESMKINQCFDQSQQQHSSHHSHNHNQSHSHNHNQHQQRPHHSHRIPMRVSTAKKGDTKTAKTLTTVMGGFIACWLPFFVYYLLKPFLPPAAVSEGLMSFFTWVGWVNCAINPFIYAFYNPDFRTAFRRIACKIICKKMPPPNHMAMFRG